MRRIAYAVLITVFALRPTLAIAALPAGMVNDGELLVDQALLGSDGGNNILPYTGADFLPVGAGSGGNGGPNLDPFLDTEAILDLLSELSPNEISGGEEQVIGGTGGGDAGSGDVGDGGDGDVGDGDVGEGDVGEGDGGDGDVGDGGQEELPPPDFGPAHLSLHEALENVLNALFGQQNVDRGLQEGSYVTAHDQFHSDHEAAAAVLAQSQQAALDTLHEGISDLAAEHDQFDHDQLQNLTAQHDAFDHERLDDLLAAEEVFSHDDLDALISDHQAFDHTALNNVTTQHTVFHPTFDGLSADLAAMQANAEKKSSKSSDLKLTSEQHTLFHDVLATNGASGSKIHADVDADKNLTGSQKGTLQGYINSYQAQEVAEHVTVHNQLDPLAAQHNGLHQELDPMQAQHDAQHAQLDPVQEQHTQLHEQLDPSAEAHTELHQDTGELEVQHEELHNAQAAEAATFNNDQEAQHEVFHEEQAADANAFQSEQQVQQDALLADQAAQETSFHTETGLPDPAPPEPAVNPVSEPATPEYDD